MKHIKRIPAELQIVIFISILLASYTWTRAALLSITHDEVGTYLGYAVNPVIEILRFTNLQLNNHVLNSLLTKLSINVFGVSEFTLRLPNLLAHLAYLVFSWQIIKRITADPYIRVGGFILANANPYLLDFFSICRGYGLEISMMVISIYFLLRFFSDNRYRDAWLSVLFSALAVLGNFTYLTGLLALVVVMNLFYLAKLIKENVSWKHLTSSLIKLDLMILIIAVGLALLIAGPVSRLETLGEFSARANANSYWTNLFTSVIRHSLYFQFPGERMENILTVVTLAILGISMITVGFLTWREKMDTFRFPFILIFYFFAIICLGFYLQHIWLGSKYPQQRTALFLYPLIIFILVGLAGQAIKLKWLRVPSRSVIILAALLGFWHFMRASTFSYYLDWQYDADTSQMLREYKDEMKASVEGQHRRMVMGTYWLYKPGIEYHENVDSLMKWMRQLTYRDNFPQPADYYYIPREFEDSLKKFDVIKLKEYPLSGAVLYKQIPKQK